MDTEADGPIPGPYSMVSLGACAAGSYDGATFTAIDPETHTFYAELKPISDQNALDDARGQADLLANLMRWTPTPAPPPAG